MLLHCVFAVHIFAGSLDGMHKSGCRFLPIKKPERRDADAPVYYYIPRNMIGNCVFVATRFSPPLGSYRYEFFQPRPGE